MYEVSLARIIRILPRDLSLFQVSKSSKVQPDSSRVRKVCFGHPPLLINISVSPNSDLQCHSQSSNRSQPQAKSLGNCPTFAKACLYGSWYCMGSLKSDSSALCYCSSEIKLSPIVNILNVNHLSLDVEGTLLHPSLRSPQSRLIRLTSFGHTYITNSMSTKSQRTTE